MAWQSVAETVDLVEARPANATGGGVTDRLFDLPAEPRLTERQQRALDLIEAAGWDGLRTDELGAALHHPKHGLNERCEFCTSAATEVGSALRRKGLVCQRRRRDSNGLVFTVWTTADAKPPAKPEHFDFPAGF